MLTTFSLTPAPCAARPASGDAAAGAPGSGDGTAHEVGNDVNGVQAAYACAAPPPMVYWSRPFPVRFLSAPSPAGPQASASLPISCAATRLHLVKGPCDRLTFLTPDGGVGCPSNTFTGRVGMRSIQRAAVPVPFFTRLRRVRLITSPWKDSPRMAQRDSEATKTVDLAYATESLAIRLVSHPDSHGGHHTTEDEWLLLQYIRQLIRAATNDETADDLAASIIKLGVFAPTVQRKMRQLVSIADHQAGHERHESVSR